MKVLKFQSPAKPPRKLVSYLENLGDCKTVYYCIEDIFSGCWMGVYGDGDNAWYEWFKFDDQEVFTTSHEGYGDTLVALREVLKMGVV